MVDHKYANLFTQDNVNKKWKIIAVDYIGYGTPVSGTRPIDDFGKVYLDENTGTYYKMQNLSPYQMGWKKVENESELTIIQNENLFTQSIELTENLCSESELRFGCCEASCLKFKVANIVKTLLGMWLTVSMILEHHNDDPLPIGKFKVESDKPTADRRHREIVAYDVMYDIIKADVSEWYNNLLPTTSDLIKMKDFRRRFIENFGLKQGEEVLVNDDVIVERTIDPEKISGLDIIRAICEINGCFGHIGRDGKFHYIYLQQDIMGLYPSNNLYPDHAPDYLQQAETGHLYPQAPDSFEIERSNCISCQYEDFITKKITKIQIRQEENDIGVVYGSGNNCYIIENNFLVYGKNEGALNQIAKNLFSKISNIVYRPFEADVRGNLCLEVGDAIRISTKYDAVESYILSREIKGGQALRDKISSSGVEIYSEKVNSINSSIIQLKKNTNTLKRTVDETVSEIYAYDESGERYSKIEQNASEINLKVSKGNISSELSLEDGKVSIKGNRLEVESENFKLDTDGNVTLEGEIVAKDGISFMYTNTDARPPITRKYVFAKTGDGFTSATPYLNIYSPNGNPCIIIGARNYSEDEFKIIDTPYFPNGAVIDSAFVKSFKQTFKEARVEYINAGGEEGTAYDGTVNLKLRASGTFVCIYGTYHTYSHKAGKSKEISFGKEGDIYLPTYTSVRAVGYEGKRVFVFTITKDGRFVVRNASDIDLNVTEEASISFRFDFFRF